MDKHVERARAAMQLRRWDLAQESLGRALADCPNNAVLHVLQAEVHYRTNDFLAATDSAREAIGLAPEWSVGYYWLTYCLLANFMASADAERLAGDAADTAIACDPDDADNYSARAQVARFGRKHQQALDYASEGLALDPENLGCLRLIALSQLDLNRAPEAETTLRRILSLDPESTFAHEHLARALMEQNRNSEAYEHAKTLIRKDPDDADVRACYGAVVRRQHPIARWLLWSGDLWYSFILVIIPLGFVPLLSIKWLELHEPWKGLATIGGVLWLLLCCCYSLVAGAVAEGLIAYSSRFNQLLPETRGLRLGYALAILAAIIAMGAVLAGVATQTSLPILVGGNILVAGAILLIARQAMTMREMVLRLGALAVPIGVQTVAFWWQPSPQRAGGAAMLVLAAWAMAIVLPLIIESRTE